MKKYVYLLMLMTVIFAGCGNNSTGEGYTSIVEGTSVQVPALTGGEIKEFRVDTGQEVQPGEVLAVVDTTELVFRRRQLQASLEELEVQWEIARSNLEQAESTESYGKRKSELKRYIKKVLLPGKV
jgi:HlyD family secretion protein